MPNVRRKSAEQQPHPIRSPLRGLLKGELRRSVSTPGTRKEGLTAKIPPEMSGVEYIHDSALTRLEHEKLEEDFTMVGSYTHNMDKVFDCTTPFKPKGSY